jgi:hypothetical protein
MVRISKILFCCILCELVPPLSWDSYFRSIQLGVRFICRSSVLRTRIQNGTRPIHVVSRLHTTQVKEINLSLVIDLEQQQCTYDTAGDPIAWKYPNTLRLHDG